jgi:hypothetical protein
MKKKDVLDIVNKYYAYHVSNKRFRKFSITNKIKTLSTLEITAYGCYLNFDKSLYAYKGRYLYICVLTIKNPYITTDQFYSAIITKEKKKELDAKGYDSVVLVRGNNIVEVVCFKNSQIEIHEIHENA